MGGVRAIDGAIDQMVEPADAIRRKIDVLRDYGEIDGCVRKMMDDTETERGRGGATTPDPPGRRRRVRRGYIHIAQDSGGNVNV